MGTAYYSVTPLGGMVLASRNLPFCVSRKLQMRRRPSQERRLLDCHE